MARRTAASTPRDVWLSAPFEQTQAALQTARLVSEEDDRRILSCITGDAGTGKSVAVRWFAAHDSTVKLVVAPPKSILTPKLFLETIGEAVGCTESHYRVADLFRALADHLGAQEYFVVADEADNLDVETLDMTRRLAEASGTRVCFVGCPKLLTTIKRHQPVHHRLCLTYSIPLLQLEDLRQAFLGRYEDDTIRAIHDNTHGNIDRVCALTLLMDKSKSHGQPAKPTPQLVRTVMSRFQLPGVAA